MRYYPIYIDIRDRPVTVIGGGDVACRKILVLRECGARVTVVSPAFCPQLAELEGIEHIQRGYRAGDLAGARLVVCATDNAAVNRAVWAEAEDRGIPCNVVDQPECCSFIVPSVLNRGDLTITVSTAGTSPSLAGRLRRTIAASLPPSIDVHLRLLAEFRTRVKASGLPPPARSRLLKAMADGEIAVTIEQDGEADARARLEQMLANALDRHQGTDRGTAP